MNRIKGVFIGVNEEPKIIEIDNELSALQKLVGGYIEVVVMKEFPDGKQIVLIMDEEGKIKRKPWNIPLYYNEHMYDIACGDVFICWSEDGEFYGNTKDAEEILQLTQIYMGMGVMDNGI